MLCSERQDCTRSRAAIDNQVSNVQIWSDNMYYVNHYGRNLVFMLEL